MSLFDFLRVGKTLCVPVLVNTLEQSSCRGESGKRRKRKEVEKGFLRLRQRKQLKLTMCLAYCPCN